MPTGTRPAPPVGTARVAIQMTVQGHRAVNVYYFQLTGTGVTVNDLKTIADGVHTTWVTNLKAFFSNAATLDTVTVSFIPSAGNELNYVGSYAEPGGSTSAIVDNAASCHVLDWVISSRYRGGKPRTYWPGVAQSTVTNGSNIDSAFAASLASAFNAWRNAINALTSTNISAVVMGTVSFQSAKVWRTPPVFVAFTSCKYGNQLKLGTQRRRIHT